MKKLLAMMMCLLLVCGLALADGDGGIATPRTYEELLAAMQDSRYHEISLRVKDFVWPEEEVTLDFATISAFVTIVGEFTFPENVTVNCAQMITIAGGEGIVTVNGPWNCLSETGMIYPKDGNVIYNGPVTFTCDETVRLSNSDTNFIFNGPLQLNAQVNARDLTLGDGVVIEGEKSLRFGGTLFVPEGEVTINAPLAAQASRKSDQPTIQGNVVVSELQVKRSPCIVAENSHVTVSFVNSGKGDTITVNGTLELAEASDHYSAWGNIHLSDMGVLIVQPEADYGGGNTEGEITGTGTLELRADLEKSERGIRHPRLWNANTRTKMPEGRIAKTVKIVKNWKE